MINRKKLHIIIPVLLSILLIVAVVVLVITIDIRTENDYEYRERNDGTIRLIRYIGDDKKVKLPSEIDGKDVSYIECCLFDYGDDVTHVTIPATVAELDNGIFCQIMSLEHIDVSGDNEHFTSEDGVLFTKDMKTLVRYPINKKDTSYTIPQSVTKIQSRAFLNSQNLTDVTIPIGVEVIEAEAFSGAVALTDVTIPDSVTTIDEKAFQTCTSLESVTLPSSITTIEDSTFSGCHSLKV